MVNYVSTKRKTKRGETNVNVSQNSQEIQLSSRRSSEEELVRVVGSSN